MTDRTSYHVPILSKETLEYMNCQPGGTYIDATLGGGGHAKMLLNASSPNGFLIGIDRDLDALEIARKTLEEFRERTKLIHGNLKDLKKLCSTLNISKVNGILMDLGISSDQLERSHRGFSFKFPDDPLDMRMDVTIPFTAAEILNKSSESLLRDILLKYGEERWAAAIAREIVHTRKAAPLRIVKDLISAIKRAVPAKARHKRRHMATKTFQALRLYVNDELNSLRKGLEAGLSLLAPGGRMVVISFHSLEDRIVKQTFIAASKKTSLMEGKRFTILTRHPVRPTQNEIMRNPRARSAKLRVLERSMP